MILSFILNLIKGNIASIVMYSVLAGVILFLWTDYQGAKEKLAKAEIAISIANSETEDANETIQEIADEYAILDDQVQKEQIKRQKAERVATQRKRELQRYLGNNATDKLNGLGVTIRMLNGLERIQGYKFEDRQALLEARPTSNAANFCFDAEGIGAIITNVNRVGDYMEEFYSQESP